MKTNSRCARFLSFPLYLATVFLATSNLALVTAAQSIPSALSPETGAATATQDDPGAALTPESTLLPRAALGVAAGDFDGDGKADLAILNSSGISILLANGDGTFRAGASYPLPQSTFVAGADFNRDGHVDLAVARENGAVSILLGNGDGTFRSPVDYAVGVGPQGMVVGDFDGDGIPDLAVANSGRANGKLAGNTVSILLGKGDGTFRSQTIFPVAEGPISIAAADLDGTGHLDLTVGTASSFGMISVLRGNGDGTFQPRVDYRTSQNSSAEAHTVAVADLNGDGALDLVVANNIPAETGANTEISVLLASPGGTWHEPVTYKTGVAMEASAVATPLLQVALADLDGDGRLDLVSAGDQVSVQFGNGDGTFAAPVLYPTAGASSVVAADFNGNGHPALAAVGRSVTILRNSPAAVLSGASGAFAPRRLHTVSPPVTALLSNPSRSPLKLSAIQITGDFSQTNDCGSQISQSAQCHIAMSFSPQAVGVRNGTLSVADSAGKVVRTLALSGQGTTDGPAVTLSASSLTFTAIRVATQATQTVQLTNSGNASLTITSIAITGTGQFSVASTCGASVDPGASCILTVTFSPGHPETQTGAVSIADDATGSPQTIMLTGSGESLAFSKTNLNFQPVLDGQTSPSLQTVTLFNVGPGALTFAAITISGTNASDFQWLPNGGPQPSFNCAAPGVLRTGDHCYINISFTPSGIGPRMALLSVTDDRDPSPATLPITGTGKAIGPIATFSAPSLSFVVVPAQRHENMLLSLTNSGDQALTIVSISLTGEFTQTNTCGASVAPAVTCQFTVTFSPTFGGAQSGAMAITDNAANSPQSIGLTGTAENIIFNKTSLAFAITPVGQTSPTQSVSLFSLGGNPLVIGSLSGPNASDFQVVSSSCGMLGFPGEIRVGDPCKLELTFTPSGQGLRTAVLTYMNYESSVNGPPVVLPLSGNGM